MVICEGMALLKRIVQRSTQKKETNLGPASQTGVGDTDASIGTGIGTVTVSDEGVSAEPSDQLDFLFIDADSKDSSLGLSAPPKSFITASALQTLFNGTHPLYFPYSLLLPLSNSSLSIHSFLSSSFPLFSVSIIEVPSSLTY